MEDATGVTHYAYDALNRRTLAQNPAGLATTYSYDSRSLRSEMHEHFGGRFTYTYDAAGRASTVKYPENRISTFAYDRSRRSGLRHGNNARVSYAYDTAGQLTDVHNMRANDATFERFTYTYDAVGNRTRVLELTGHRMTFSYDNTNQLVREQRSDVIADFNWDYTHTYDGVGNRTVWSDPTSDTNYAYDAANQVTADSYVTPYTYDGAGNLRGATYLGLFTLTWDAENRLTRYEDGYFGIDDRYQYDGDGRRVRREALNPGSVFQYLWDFENVLLEFNDDGTLATRYTLEPAGFGNLLSDKIVYFFNAERFYHYDGLGSTRRLTNFQGTPLDVTMHYEAFGFPKNAGDPFSSYRWLGQIGYQLQVIPGNGFLFGGYYDYANYYVRQRYYDRWTARWTSRDPIGFDGGDANLYRYGVNSPLEFFDPTGLRKWTLWDKAQFTFWVFYYAWKNRNSSPPPRPVPPSQRLPSPPTPYKPKPAPQAPPTWKPGDPPVGAEYEKVQVPTEIEPNYRPIPEPPEPFIPLNPNIDTKPPTFSPQSWTPNNSGPAGGQPLAGGPGSGGGSGPGSNGGRGNDGSSPCNPNCSC
jgi:RHS repeat-associated protein